VIHGKTVIRLVVERDGRPSAMEILETEGHESLHQASIAALRAFAPYAPLPPDFPEEKLVIHLTLQYPAWKR
jgi:TonB family protein